MRLNDIHTDLNPNIDLRKSKKNKTISIGDELHLDIDNISISLNQNIRLNNQKKTISKSKINKHIDTLKKIKLSKNKINLKDIIKNQAFFPLLFQNISFQANKIKKLFPINYNKKTNYILLILFFLFFDFIFASLFLFLGFNTIKSINNHNYLSKTSKSHTYLNISNFLFKPFKIIPNNNIKNIILLSEIGKDSTFIAKEYGILINKNKNLFLTDILKSNKDTFKHEEVIKNIKINLEKLELTNNSKYKNHLNIYKNLIEYIYIVINDYNQNPKILLSMLGDFEIKKYLILFQNNDEIRATGGFPGSVGIISIYKGKIIDFKKEDIYNLEWNINKVYKEKLPSPKGLNKINPHFTLKDSNYFSDFIQSANSINFFLQKGGYNYDGIIYMNTNSINKILGEIGGVYFKDIGTKITGENFNQIISLLVEAKISKKGTLGTPKKILFDFSKIFEEKIKKSGKRIKIIKVILDDLKNREIVIVNLGKNENSLLKKLKLNGTINYKKYNNFIYPVYTSLSQNKSDRYIELNYTINTEIIHKKTNKCDLKNNLTLKLKHNFSNNDEKILSNNLNKFNIEKTDKILNIQGKGNNKQYIRIILPKNSNIKENSNIKIIENNNSKLVEIYTDIKAGNTEEIKISYTINNINCNNSDFIIFKQPGIKKYNVNYTFKDENSTLKNINLINQEKDLYIKIDN